MPGIIIVIILLALILLYFIFCLLKHWKFIQDHKICPHCGNEMDVLWVDEELDPRTEKVHIGSTRVIAGKVTQYTPYLWCRQCGYDIPVNQNNTERG